MYTDQQLASLMRHSSPLAAEEQRQRRANYSKRTVENLIEAGVVVPDSTTREPAGPRSSSKKKSVGFKVSVKEISPRQSLVVPPRAPNLDQHHHNTTGTAAHVDKLAGRSHLASTIARSWSRKSKLKELHHDEMFASKGTGRRERTFIGTNCAACEEPLEHMLRGERILQLSCGHVAHEACFYEYIKEFEAETCPECQKPLGIDTTRGGNIDFENLNKLVRNVQTPDLRERRDPEPTPTNHDVETLRRPSVISQQIPSPQRRGPSRDHLLPEQFQSSSHRHDRYDSSHISHPSHTRNASGETGVTSSNGYAETHHTGGRRHDYDVQSMEASVNSPQHMSRNPIPAPIVTVRSEFPTLSKSRHQQSLTCLVTVEVVEGKWNPNAEDFRRPPPMPSTIPKETFDSPPVRPEPRPEEARRLVDSVHEDLALDGVRDELFRRVDNWHGLDFQRFGRLVMHGVVRVGKDQQTWQELECFLFSEMLICVKEKKLSANSSQQWDDAEGPRSTTRCTLKGSILIKRHLKQVDISPGDVVLTLRLSVLELPAFHLQFQERRQLEVWRKALVNINRPEPPLPPPQRLEYEHDNSGTDEDEHVSRHGQRTSSIPSSSYGGTRSQATAPTEYTPSRDLRLGTSSIHVPLDIVVVIPVSSSMHGLKMNLLRDSLRFLVSSLGERDRMGLVTFGSGVGGVPLVGMTTKTWRGWSGALDAVRPVPHKNLRADVVEGANVAVDLLMQRKSSNPLSHIILISDSSSSDSESIDFVVSRAEAAKISIHSFGLGLTHKPDTMVEMASKTKASYTYVKDWMMLRECLAGCLGALQSISHQNVKLRLRLPEGSPAKFVKVSGALQVTKRATGRDAEASLGDLRFGDKRDILVQLAIQADSATPDSVPVDPWENIISGLEALGPMEQEDTRPVSVEEVPVLQADLSWGDILRDGSMSQLSRPSLLAITMLPPPPKKGSYRRPMTPPIPPHPSVVQRRMELLTSDMLSRALGLVSRGQNDRAQHLLAETRSILKGLGKGGLPPLPTPPPTSALPPTPRFGGGSPLDAPFPPPPSARRTPSPGYTNESPNPYTPAAGIDRTTMTALDSELKSSLEWICHPAVFGRDSRKAVLQAIGVISSQRAYTFRTPSESLWAIRIPGVRRLTDRSREWREADDALMEES